MTTQTFSLSLLLLALSVPALAAPEAAPMPVPVPPLNLSLPPETPHSTDAPFRAGAAGNLPMRNDPLPEMTGARQGAGRMPYGSGYEARQRGAAQSSGTGRGGGGRGGMGRGR